MCQPWWFSQQRVMLLSSLTVMKFNIDQLLQYYCAAWMGYFNSSARYFKHKFSDWIVLPFCNFSRICYGIPPFNGTPVQKNSSTHTWKIVLVPILLKNICNLKNSTLLPFQDVCKSKGDDPYGGVLLYIVTCAVNETELKLCIMLICSMFC